MKANQFFAEVRENEGAKLAPRFLSTLAVLISLLIFTASPLYADTRAKAVANAELLMLLDQMQQEIKTLRNMVEQQENALSKMQTEQRNRYLDLDQRAQEYSKRILNLEEKGVSPTPSRAEKLATEESTTPATTNNKSSISNSSSAKSITDQQAYNQAYAHVPEQRFEEAVSEFQAFIRQYPDSRLIGNAYYWLGEIYMVQNRTADAEKMFNAVVSNHPNSFKIADSKYKLGLIYARYGNNSKAKETMEALIVEHPREPAADLARSYLKK